MPRLVSRTSGADDQEMLKTVLTAREQECLEGLARGLSNNGVAKHLGICVPTVAMHLANARRKLGAMTREQAIALAVHRRLIAP